MRQLSICLINPRFDPSYYGLQYMLSLVPGDKRATMLVGALPLLAALVPDGHQVTLIDENVEEIDFDALQNFDIIGVTGMIVQKRRMDEILEHLSGSKAIVCVGGPYATVDEEFFRGRCDVLFVGEADETWPGFINDVAAGHPVEGRYKQATPTDMARVPTPRFDLARTHRYLCASIQFSRGCPFLCEFCDIIVMFGRKPRAKTPAQVLAELDALFALGVRQVFFVDDNFIGNKVFAKALLRVVIEWQERHDYAMLFSTEASINLADDAELMGLLWQANFRWVFIGIESPRPESLLETRKVQNVRGDSIDAKLLRVREAGLIVHAGFIVGFDNDDERVFDEQFHFIQRNGIAIAAVSVLSPIPTTPLYDRLAREGRLVPEDDVWFEPKQMSREVLKRGYADLHQRLYTPEAFFERVFKGNEASPVFRKRRQEMDARRKRGAFDRLLGAYVTLVITWRLSLALAREGLLGTLGRAYVKAYMEYNKPFGREALGLAQFLPMCARHWHYYKISGVAWGGAGTLRPSTNQPEQVGAELHPSAIQPDRVAARELVA